ncbi:hypothetical protein MSG28_007315 [Choristoneura fumiferana]|uniref:Uncharacterized protein n=1 Tax=Choristoneura fumiferana TaxID=7141 RepID=A0ACC0JWX6_CHOFU|nr:hypothetical protein MSG28_007315 [Choristoneura fumiferana]
MSFMVKENIVRKLHTPQWRMKFPIHSLGPARNLGASLLILTESMFPAVGQYDTGRSGGNYVPELKVDRPFLFHLKVEEKSLFTGIFGLGMDHATPKAPPHSCVMNGGNPDL